MCCSRLLIQAWWFCRCRLSRFLGNLPKLIFIPFILFRKVKIADIILDNLHISFCIILDYIFLTDNIHFLFLAIIFFIFSLYLLLLLKQKGGRFKSYQLSFLFSITFTICPWTMVFGSSFWQKYTVRYSNLNTTDLLDYSFQHHLLWCINQNLFVHYKLPCTRRNFWIFWDCWD